MSYIDEIIYKIFKDEKIISLEEINSDWTNNDNINKTNYYFKLITHKQIYFIKIKRNLKNEIRFYNILRNIIPIPYFYYYGALKDNMEYLIEEFVDSVNLYKINTNDPLYRPLLFSVGEAFGKVFNIKRNKKIECENINLSILTEHEKSIFKKYYNEYYLYDGLILFDVAYLCSIYNKIELKKVSDLENCLYGDIRPYISIYKQIFGDYFILGFNSSSKIKYDKLEVFDKEEYFNAQLIKEKVYKQNWLIYKGDKYEYL